MVNRDYLASAPRPATRLTLGLFPDNHVSPRARRYMAHQRRRTIKALITGFVWGCAATLVLITLLEVAR